MTGEFNNVFVKETSLVAGKLEKNGNVSDYFDKTYDTYNIDTSLELSEVKMTNDVIDIILKKQNIKKEDIDLMIGGDLLNQICATSYAINKYNRPFLGTFAACATSNENIIVGSSLIENNFIKNCICTTSSHNLAEEKQFRNPTEYGYTKPKTSTTTATGASAIMLTSEKTNIKVKNFTIGKIVDMKQNDPNNMGAVMAPAAADTIFTHLENLKLTHDYYDLILTGDLGVYGKEILKDYMKENYNIKLSNYNDCGVMLYNLDKQKQITAGASGPVCSTLVNYGYIYNMLKEKKLKKVLLVTTGALFSPTFVFQKQNILGIAHAVSLEVVKWHMFIHSFFADYYA